MSIDVMDKANEVVIARADNPELVKGRREFFSYRELGVTKATEGKMRAQVTIATQGLSEETGWHVHLCEGQFVYILEGWVDLEFAGNRKERIVAGDSIFIPGDTPHNETATSEEFQILEVSIPADMGTEPCAKPD
ncbi:MAG: cupin [Rhodospirillaceae bacterium]|jgi:quercetin dioxygenase-like cupin family protein|nr:cupin [Rhodospirillaceae bacterium]